MKRTIAIIIIISLSFFLPFLVYAAGPVHETFPKIGMSKKQVLDEINIPESQLEKYISVNADSVAEGWTVFKHNDGSWAIKCRAETSCELWSFTFINNKLYLYGTVYPPKN